MSYSSQSSKLANKSLSITSTDSKEPNKTTEQDPTQDGASHSSLDLTTIMLISGSLTLAVLSGLLLYCIIKKILRNRMERDHLNSSMLSYLIAYDVPFEDRHLSTKVRQSVGNPTSSSVSGSTGHKEESSNLRVTMIAKEIRSDSVAVKPTPEVPYESKFYIWENSIGEMVDKIRQQSHAIVFKKGQNFGLLVYNNNYYRAEIESRGRYPLYFLPFSTDEFETYGNPKASKSSIKYLIRNIYRAKQIHKFAPRNVKEDATFKAFVTQQLATFPEISSQAPNVVVAEFGQILWHTSPSRFRRLFSNISCHIS